MVRIISWNVNGLRPDVLDNFLDKQSFPDVLGIQEAKVAERKLLEPLRLPGSFRHSAWAFALKPGYGGVTTFSTTPPLRSTVGLGIECFDNEGRVVETEFDRFTLFNAYVPSGHDSKKQKDRLAFKLEFLEAVFARVQARRSELRKPVVLVGDFNTAHQEIDLADPRSGRRGSGFLPVERELLTRFLELGFVDSYRHLHPNRVQYTWQRGQGLGWRIDYVLVSEDLVPHVTEAFILGHVAGSDHCPVGIELDL